MIKSELIARLAEQNPHLFQRDVERIVNGWRDKCSAAEHATGQDILDQFGVTEYRFDA